MERDTINISLETLIKKCSLGLVSNEELFQRFCLMNRLNIHEVFRYKKFRDDFTDYLTCYADSNQVIGMIRPSYDEFIKKVKLFLNASVSDDIREDSLTDILHERLDILRSITSENELKEEFPIIYNDLVQGRKYMKELQALEKSNPELGEEGRHYFYSCALKQRLDRFIETQSKLYERLIDKRNLYKNLIASKSYNSFIANNFNIDKIALYVVDGYLKECENNTDKAIIKKNLRHVLNYFDSDYDKSVTLSINSLNDINVQNIKNRVANIERKLNDNEGLVEWVIIPDGKKLDKVKNVSSNHPKVSVSSRELEELKRKGERKNRFYEGTNYLVKVAGLYKYRGYIAYIYPNGEILIDREYDPSKPKSDKGNAIYHMHSVDFLRLSKLDKTTLKNHPSVGRIIHSKNWEKNAKAIIDKETSSIDRENAIQLVKKLKEKK